ARACSQACAGCVTLPARASTSLSSQRKTWMAGTSPAITPTECWEGALQPCRLELDARLRAGQERDQGARRLGVRASRGHRRHERNHEAKWIRNRPDHGDALVRDQLGQVGVADLGAALGDRLSHLEAAPQQKRLLVDLVGNLEPLKQPGEEDAGG